MSITITIEAPNARMARLEMEALLAGPPIVEVSGSRPRTEDIDLADGQEHADEVKFPEPQAEQPAPRRRGRPRKDAQPVEIADPGQIDIEEAIAATTITAEDAAAAIAGDKPVEEIVAEAQTSPDTDGASDVQDAAPTPADPEAGWTTADARNAGRALLDRAPDTETGNRALAALLQPFGIMQVKLLKTEQIEAFVIAANGKVFR